MNLITLSSNIFFVLQIFIIVRTVRSFSDVEVSDESFENLAEENDTLLESNDPINVGFYLYPSREATSDYDILTVGDAGSLKQSRYNKNNPPLFLIHGFLNNYTTRYSQRMKNAFLENGFNSIHNIIVVDWGKLAQPANRTQWLHDHLHDPNQDLFYRAAVRNVPRVGNRIAEMIEFLGNEKYLDSPENVYLLGFSLGAQISGYAGYFVRQNLSTPIGRITGFDPAGPLYQHVGVDSRIDSSDASFVDIVHSNQGQDGYYGSAGNADFHPNGGGPNQPDCIDVDVGVVTDTVTGSCAHNRAWIYYIKALNESIVACKCLSYADILCRAFCSNKAQFGYACPPTARGNYYFDIFVREP